MTRDKYLNIYSEKKCHFCIFLSLFAKRYKYTRILSNQKKSVLFGFFCFCFLKMAFYKAKYIFINSF